MVDRRPSSAIPSSTIASICLRAAYLLAQPVETLTCAVGQPAESAGRAFTAAGSALAAPAKDARSAPQSRRIATGVRSGLLKVRESYPLEVVYGRAVQSLSRFRFRASAAISVLAFAALATPAAGLAAPKHHPQAGQREAKVNAAVRAVMKQREIPGVILGIWQAGQAPIVKAYGTRRVDLQTHTPGKKMTTNLHMRIGSETKTFTGTAVLQLVDEGKVGLDDPIRKYIPGVPNGNAITIRELGDMRSGLVSYTANEAWDKILFSDPRRPWTPQELLSYSFSQPPLFPPNGTFNYSNTNFVLLGLLVEKVSGEKLGTYFERHILRPLHMDNTVFPSNAAFPRPHADGYTVQDQAGTVANTTNWDPSWGWAAGAMISDLHDLAIWAKSVATGSLLTPATQRQRERFIPAPDLAPARYGFALFDVKGWIGHNGSLPGYESLTIHSPSQRATMVILLNSDIAPPAGDLTTLVGKAVTRVITPDNVFYFKPGGQSKPAH
jgi:D-alanyl-D-alanine carboxypeptidase